MTDLRKRYVEGLSYEKAIETLHRMARINIKHPEWGWEKEHEIWRLAEDWNDLHDGEGEIFMCEYSLDKDGNEMGYVTGFCIEDDYYLYKEEK